MSIVEFLLARVAEDEEAVERIESEPCHGIESLAEADYLRFVNRAETEIDAKRKIIEMHPARWQEVELGRKMCEEEPRVERVGGPFYDDELRILATVYASHPDYRDEWQA